jgi:hypothetical protein
MKVEGRVAMKRSLAALAAFALASCGSHGAGNNQQAAAGGAGSAASGGSGSMMLQPGEWETTIQVEMAGLPDMPAGVERPTMPATTVRSCLTPEEAARANAAFLSGGSQGMPAGVRCDYSNVHVAGGRIQGTSSCSMSGMEITANIDGNFTPTSYEMTQQSHMVRGGMTIDSTNHITGRRVGECSASDASGSK